MTEAKILSYKELQSFQGKTVRNIPSVWHKSHQIDRGIGGNLASFQNGKLSLNGKASITKWLKCEFAEVTVFYRKHYMKEMKATCMPFSTR